MSLYAIYVEVAGTNLRVRDHDGRFSYAGWSSPDFSVWDNADEPNRVAQTVSELNPGFKVWVGAA